MHLLGAVGGGAAIAAAGVVVAAAALAPSASAAWREPVGGASPISETSGALSSDASLAAVGGSPFVAWAEPDGTNSEIRVAVLDAAGTAWRQPWFLASPTDGRVNQASDRDARAPTIADVGGVAHVAWIEDDGTNVEVRVARLTASPAGARWMQPWSGAGAAYGGINVSATRNAFEPHLASIGGVPHVAWVEDDGTNREVRVSRLNGDVWEPVVGGASPVNRDAAQDASSPRLADVRGVPHVAWREFDGANMEVRVSRLNAAGTAWEELVGGPSPINRDPDEDAGRVALADVGGVPHVAWDEHDGTNYETRVSRLNAAGTAWEEPTGGASPINRDGSRDGGDASLAAIDGVPYVAWREADGTNLELRVARLETTGFDAWNELAGGASPINASAAATARAASLAVVGGVPWVAWTEGDGASFETRVSRLEPELGTATATPTETGATLSVPVRTFGLPYPVGFEFGAGLEREAPAEPTPAGVDSVTVVRRVDGLDPATTYQLRPFATAGVLAPRVLGATGSFTTPGPAPATPPPAGPDADPAPGAAPGDTTRPVFVGRARAVPARFAVDRRGRRERAVRSARRGTTFRFALSERARVVFTLERRRGRRGRRARFTRVGAFAHAARAGANRRRFSGRIGRRTLRPGSYRATLVATDAAGNRSRPRRIRLTVVRR